MRKFRIRKFRSKLTGSPQKQSDCCLLLLTVKLKFKCVGNLIVLLTIA
jgi:hypothetical protein